MDIEIWKEFISQNWLVIVIALILLFVVINVLRTVLKWAIVVVIVAALIIYSGVSFDQIKTVVTDVGTSTMDTLRTEAAELMQKEAAKAEYVVNPDGTFTITSPNVEVNGKQGEDKVKVSVRGISLGEWSINDTVRLFMETAQNR
ncbi:ATPase [Paenibacillus urinalis]|uniref:ATPase n=1 Tax=Paenibacillus urinalis TaxID=521520 RepID=A0AAX3MXG9_9BACL|nr:MULTISPECIES: hypothetical protein [Paenibacillus]WDH81962.1 ATPase [Paenibacillus urinalis]WDH98008.1 ATPase [Paenibacillus urinalis]WDI01690.1 ATPase [Paenibacillus urinalis]GAK42508.1 hypothetical protein TCA2_5000 [Paenibacillus sp. TCA20]